MPSLTAKRTLVKSPPELWSELSEVDRLAKHLEAFGEITITKLEPEHTVAWEGDTASGTVSIEPSGWGTKVTMTARVEEAEAEAEPVPEPEPEPEPEAVVEAEPEPEPLVEPEPEFARKPGFFARLFARPPKRAEEIPEAAEPEPAAGKSEPEPPAREPELEPRAAAPVPEPPAPADGAADRAKAALEDALEALGSAHHRPFSRG